MEHFFWLSEQDPITYHLHLFFPLEENVGKQIEWRVEASLTLCTQLRGSSTLCSLLLGLLCIYPLHQPSITMVMQIASFVSHSQVLNSPLADRESLGTKFRCIYYIWTGVPGLFNDPSNSFCELCWSHTLMQGMQRVLLPPCSYSTFRIYWYVKSVVLVYSTSGYYPFKLASLSSDESSCMCRKK